MRWAQPIDIDRREIVPLSASRLPDQPLSLPVVTGRRPRPLIDAKRRGSVVVRREGRGPICGFRFAHATPHMCDDLVDPAADEPALCQFEKLVVAEIRHVAAGAATDA